MFMENMNNMVVGEEHIRDRWKGFGTRRNMMFGTIG